MSTTGEPRAVPRSLGLTRFFLVLVAAGALIAGPAYWVNGLTHRHGPVEVPVRYVAADGIGATSVLDAAFGEVGLSLPPALADRGADARPATSLSVQNDDLDLSVWDSTLAEQALARGDDLVRALALGVGALLLWRVVASLGDGRPFTRGNAARVLGVAGAVALSGVLAPLLAQAAAALVLDRLGGAAAGALRPATLTPDLGLAVLVGLLLALAEVFRHGERLAGETDGLV